MAEERSLDEALELAEQLVREVPEGGLGVDICPACNEETFAIKGYSSDGVIPYGECLHCGTEIAEDEAEDAAGDLRAEQDIS